MRFQGGRTDVTERMSARDRDTPSQISRELRRIGVDEQRLGTLTVGGITADRLLRWIRWLPTNLGHEEFVRRLEQWADEPKPSATAEGAAPPEKTIGLDSGDTAARPPAVDRDEDPAV